MAVMGEIRTRLVRVVEFVAEGLEEEANRLPPSRKSEADSFRRMAEILRSSDNPRLVRVSEEGSADQV